MNATSSTQSGSSVKYMAALWTCLVMGLVLLGIFRANLTPENILFSNDSPLGAFSAAPFELPGYLAGAWYDLNTLGYQVGGSPTITQGLRWVLGPVMYAKWYAPIAIFILGFGVWCFLRQLRLNPIACLLGGLAAALNSAFFSAATWGMAPHTLTIAMSFFALAAVASPNARGSWLRLVLAGFAVGLGIMEGADLGAIFSLLVAAFVVYQSFAVDGSTSRKLKQAVVRVGLVAVCAALTAAHALGLLISTQIQGVAGTSQDTQTKEQRWDWATQWSLPKAEGLSFFVPGLFGYRMDTPQGLPESLQKNYSGGNYWGAVGRDPNWDRYFASGKQGQPPAGFMRFTGGGIYAGILVVLVAAWSVFQGFRKKDSVFSLSSRRWVWFWFGVLVVAVLLSFGRFAPFYQFLYMLPYFSTIRNPAKFSHVANWALVVLFAYGVNGLWRTYVETASSSSEGLVNGIKAWWKRVRGFDRRWTLGSFAFLGATMLGWLIYSSSRTNLVQHLQEVQFDQTTAEAIAAFSIGQLGWFVLLLMVAIALLTLVLSGAFAGSRGRWGALALGVFLVLDLGRANLPWIITWDYQQKYASNPVLDRLREKPYLQRVAILPGWIGDALRAPPELGMIDQLYRIEWAQHHFFYYNIHSLDIVQLPRMPADLLAFETALQPRSMTDVPLLVPRRWQLTSTRYLLGAADFLPFLNQQLDAGKARFQIVERFQIAPKPGIPRPTKLEELTAVPATNGSFAVFEFTGALPRASLYSQWQVVTNEQSTLEQLANPAFDPAQLVLVSPPAPVPAGTNATQQPGTVTYTSYAPKHIVLKAEANAPSILLLNDRFDANWNVYVDGRKETLLKCNYLMRGVHLPVGTHEVAFRFEPPTQYLYISLAAVAIGLLLSVMLLFVRKQPVASQDSTSPTGSTSE